MYLNLIRLFCNNPRILIILSKNKDETIGTLLLSLPFQTKIFTE